ncbi:MAG: hypothetical protein SWH61_01980 [Thermodesulfobacteriota bacterium]|nr:hypothetical protein [Thermodesulfobacteriota bacterium]
MTTRCDIIRLKNCFTAYVNRLIARAAEPPADMPAGDNMAVFSGNHHSANAR